jgi:hypothetical protein
VQRFDHTAVGYRLRGAHALAACSACHRPEARAASGTALSTTCAGCHADPHDGFFGLACAECHSSARWTPDAMLARHQQTRLPLTGVHALVDCTSCHPRADAGAFSGVPVTCLGCHRAEYEDPATHPDHRVAGFGPRCGDCHRPAGWSPAYFPHPSFPLDGQHRTASCNSCHNREPVPRECVGCHADDLDSALTPDHRQLDFTDRCERCHRTSGWRPASFPDHERRFPIARGAHAGFDCADCHTDPSNFGVYSCTGACHPRSRMDNEHRDEPGYVYDDRACLMCHPRGDKQ